MTDVPAEDRVGKVIDGRYKITQLMASGSMGSVYQAERVPVGKIVAIKFLHSSFAGDSEFQARFERETRVMSKLAHPNCVSVLDFGVWENEPYLVMDFVAGRTLRAIIDGGALPAPRALALARQIAAGLAHAHEQGVIHRDIKPANIMITDEIGTGERVRILDFGLARLRGNVGRDATQINMVVGTPNYMAPEQTVGGAIIDARTDIYAVGVVLYEMVVGDRPFHAEDTLQLLGMHRAAPIPRLHDRVKEGTLVPVGLQELIDRALAKSPADRYQTAIELAQAIDDVALGRTGVPDAGDEDTTYPRTGPVVIASTKTKKSTGTAAVAPTMLSVDNSGIARDEVVAPSRRGVSWIGLMLVVGGVAAMAGYLIKREKSGAHAKLDAGAHPTRDGAAGPIVATTGDAAPVLPFAVDAAPPLTDAGIDAPPDAPWVFDAFPPGWDPTAAGSGSGSDDVEMDPEKAEDLDPSKGSATKADDEAADAPKNADEVEKKTPTASQPQLARTLHEAVLMIKDGKRELALASLRELEKKTPGSSYIPFLLGNLYYDQRWWGVAMDEYAVAIKHNAAYKKNPTLIRNVIRMLSSPHTAGKASGFLRFSIGHPARLQLKWASEHEDNPVVRKRAADLMRYIR